MYLLLLQLFSFLALSQGVRYLGCFNERSTKDRLFKRDFTTLPKTLTHEVCWENCRSKGYNFAGVQWGKECFCTEEHPDMSWLAKTEDECDMTCSGDDLLLCGGFLRMGIFKLDEEEDPSYRGCVQPGALSEATIESESMTKATCKKHCEDSNFLYYGMTGGSSCSCGNDLDWQAGNSYDKCRAPCSGDSREICGGQDNQHLSAFRSDVVEPVPQYLGCFRERSRKDRLFKGDRKDFHDSNSAEVCTEFCTNGGFAYAGIQWGHECFCSNEPAGDEWKAATEEECDMACTGDHDQKCGGYFRMGIYKLPQKA